MDLVKGGVHSRGTYVPKKLYFKMKESGPEVGGGRALGTPLDPPMYIIYLCYFIILS